MGYSIELDEETSRQLQERAKELDVDPQTLGRDYVRAELCKFSPIKEPRGERMRLFDEVLRELEKISVRAGAPSLPDEALTREAIYADHD